MKSGGMALAGVCACVAVASACGGGSVTGALPDASADGPSQDRLEVVLSDGSEEPGTEVRADGEVPWPDGREEADGEEPDQGPEATDAPAEAEVPVPGGLHWPCDDPNDCLSAVCIDTLRGHECTIACASGETCPAGWLCAKVGGGVDSQYACVDPAANLCRPCINDADCATEYDTGGKNVCIEQGPEGRFCGRYCGEATACPEGFECVAVGVGRDIMMQCRPADGAPCPCTDKFRDKAYLTVCYAENEFGRCQGQRTCDKECDAPEPLPESCNNKDDDCDGLTDDAVPQHECDLKPNQYGTCKGTSICVGGTELCEGTQAGPEVCNGKDDNCDGATDEGFPDDDLDGIPNCMDQDRDGDGVVDGADNCPNDWNADQADCNEDGTGDACDPDDDHDGVQDGKDNCRCVLNQDQKNIDGDEFGDACDCDLDGDGHMNLAAGCEAPRTPDNCTYVPNPSQADLDGNGIGDACDEDMDGDGVVNIVDNCPAAANNGQENVDFDTLGDACDCDLDGDGAGNEATGCEPSSPVDNCPYTSNPAQVDTDDDGLGDACDCDADEDGVGNRASGCPVPDPEDNCPGTWNEDQADVNGNGVGDACEDDWDGDGIANADDDCPWTANQDQADMDSDGEGDACDCDIDADAVSNEGPSQDGGQCPVPATVDNCTMVANPFQEDLNQDGQGDACDPDIDGDGDPNETDCAPYDPWIFHGQIEACNGHDDNCNGLSDEAGALGCSIFYFDEDGDGYGTDANQCLCGPSGFYTTAEKGDCQDSDKDVNPAATEACNGKDDDCDTQTDEVDATGCVVYFRDIDKDGYGLTADFRCLCVVAEPYTTTKKDDCSDTDPDVFPGAQERCNGKDDDCDANIDEEGAIGCSTFYRDSDRDGFGLGNDTKCLCSAAPPYDSKAATDCDDTRDDVNPQVQERCNGIDDNCNKAIDEDNAVGCTTYYMDADRDTFGIANASQCKCNPVAPYDTLATGDCNDGDKLVYPGAPESCNGKDDDCDTTTDEEGAAGCGTWYFDDDGDSYGSNVSKCLCSPWGKYTSSFGNDCADNDKNVYPGAPESCNGKDDDCDTQTDEEGALNCVKHYLDSDHDGFGSTQHKCLCGPSGDYTSLLGTDCDDGKPLVYPGATEVCKNNLDDDCDTLIDEEGCQGCTTYYLDSDGDGYGQTAFSKCLSVPSGDWRALLNGDCNDSRADVNPGKPELCSTVGVDDNCSGAADEEGASGCATWYYDKDGDHFGAIGGASKCLCAPSGSYSASVQGDCADEDATVNPNVTESCNGKDDNCKNGIDEEGASLCKTYYKDGDRDGFGAGTSRCLCAASNPWDSTTSTDCNDSNAAIKPGAIEKCNGNVDDNCDGSADGEGSQGCHDYFYDSDNDNYGVGTAKCLCVETGMYRGDLPGDCADSDAAVNPAATEKCNSKDDDCDGTVDEERTSGSCGADGYATYYYDADGDGYGVTSPAAHCLCSANANFRALVTGDCNDTNSAIKPGATEQCDGVDNNCTGTIDEASALAMCGSVQNGSPSCSGGRCVAVCTSGYFDVDAQFSNGCECSEDGYGLLNNTCDTAKDLGNLAEGGSIPVNGYILPDNDSDWFKVRVVDAADSGTWAAPGNDKQHFKVTITSPGGSIKVAVRRGSCADTSMCSANPQDVVEWYSNFTSGSGSTAVGEAPCVTASPPGGGTWNCCKSGECQAPATPNGCCGGINNNNTTQCTDATHDKRHCQDRSETFYLRVYRTSGSASTCAAAAYSITLTN